MDINEAVEAADFWFWQSIAQSYPSVKTGDFPPDAAHELHQAQTKAIKIWLSLNDQNSTNE